MTDILTAIEHLGVAGLTLALWWLERKERIKLATRLDKCLEERAREAGHRHRGQ